MVHSSAVAEHLQDPITHHMRSDFARLFAEQTVGEALAAIRDKPPAGRIIYFYVTDAENRLLGVVPTRRLLLNPSNTKVAEIMVRDVVAMPRSATVLNACEFFTLHRLLALPVVDEERRLIGTVDVELYTKELEGIDRSERSDELFQLIGVHMQDVQQASPVRAFRSRFPWLITNITGGIVAAFLSGLFEAELKNVVQLALFIPVVLALAESVAIQSVSLSLQLLHGQRPTLASIGAKLRAEFFTGGMLGVASGTVVALVALVWHFNNPKLALCLLGGIAGAVTGAALIGVAAPNLLRFLRRDPQVAAGPIALASADMLTLALYFSLARVLFPS